jgi:GDSL-like Lipase/Acylhydrolase
MKNISNKLVIVAAFGSLLSSCKPDLAIPTASIGSLNLTSYVAIGNSLTAGYQSNGLSYEGQKSSYVTILAEQFKLVKPDLVFKTPYVDQASIGCGAPGITIEPPLTNIGAVVTSNVTITIKGTAPYTIQSLPKCNGGSSLAPAPAMDHGDLSIILDPTQSDYDASTNSYSKTFAGSSIITGGFPNIKTAPSIYNTAGPFNNMGVSGARCVDVNRVGFGGPSLIKIDQALILTDINKAIIQSNPYFSRFAKDQTTSSMLSDAMLLNPSFFSLFIGNNDVLLWASQGGVSGTGTSTITPVQEFSDSIDVIVNTLLTSAKQGVIINVPQITGAAFFTFMPTKDMPAKTDCYIVDETNAVRLMHADEMILLTVPQDSVICHGMGKTAAYPIPKKYTMTTAQIAQATTAIDAYNVHIKSLADANNLAFFDMNGFTKANQSGSKYNGMDMNGTFVTGGIFSLDGLHLTARGYAAVANEIIKVINTKYNSTIPGTDLTKIYGVPFGN